MTEDVPKNDPWMAPPDWVHLPELSEWIERRFGILGSPMLPQIISDLRSDRLRHRVEWPHGLLDQTKILRKWRAETVLPPGLSKAERPSRVIVHDWELAQVDWRAGTVGGLPADYRGLKWPDKFVNQDRLKIEVQWSHVEWIYSLYRIDESRSLNLTQAAVSPSGVATASGMAAASHSASATPRRHNGTDHRIADAPLIETMRTMIEAGRARSPEDAARALVGQATGHGLPASKVKRLALRYRKTDCPTGRLVVEGFE